MPDRWTEFNEMFRTRACARDAHTDCPHLIDIGGGIDPRRFPRVRRGPLRVLLSRVLPGHRDHEADDGPGEDLVHLMTVPGAGQAWQGMKEAGAGVSRLRRG